MRFKDFLVENESMSFTALCEAIKKNCKPFLEVDRPLYRGFKKSKAKFYPHPEERKPLDSSAGFNFMFNAGIEKAFELKDIRKRSIFASGDAVATADYGDVCFMFIAGRYDFLWSPYVEDSVDDNETLFDQLIYKMKSSIESISKSSMVMVRVQLKSIFDQLKNKISISEWLVSGKDITNEINSKAHDIHFGPIDVTDVYTPLVNSLENVFERYYKTSDIAAAIKSGNEILFYETGGYYLVPVEYVRAQMVLDGMDKHHFSDEEIYEYLMKNIRDSGHE